LGRLYKLLKINYKQAWRLRWAMNAYRAMPLLERSDKMIAFRK